jgi:hypothetical protein
VRVVALQWGDDLHIDVRTQKNRSKNDWSTDVKVPIGIAQVRAIQKQLKQDYPKAKQYVGNRVTGWHSSDDPRNPGKWLTVPIAASGDILTMLIEAGNESRTVV